jgi:ATP/maltotriose-dependent transcriptional regulator MalT
MHTGTTLRWSGDPEGAAEAFGRALGSVGAERDPYLAQNCQANLALAEGLLGADRRGALSDIAAHAAVAGLGSVHLKAVMFAGLLANGNDQLSEAADLLAFCLPQQLELGHVNIVAQELSPFPELIGQVLRRHSQDGLASALIDALSRQWRFSEALPLLREMATPQVLELLSSVEPQGDSNSSRNGRPATVCEGQSYCGVEHLTTRESQVLELMAQDRSNDQIAGELFIALSTVKTHVNHILRKLGQKTRIGAVLEYQRLVDASPPGLRPEINPRYDSNKRPRH